MLKLSVWTVTNVTHHLLAKIAYEAVYSDVRFAREASSALAAFVSAALVQ